MLYHKKELSLFIVKRILTSPIYICCIILLVLNDHIWKYTYHNWFTGKLSDFVGLFVFTLLLISFFPKKKIHVSFIASILFIWWKSTFSEPFIVLFSNYFYPISRIIDYTDLYAIIMPFIAVWISEKKVYTLKLHSSIPIVISCFAFMATSYKTNLEYHKKYTIPHPKEECIELINEFVISEHNENIPLSIHYENTNLTEYNNTLKDSVRFYKSRDSIAYDTVWAYKKNKIDSIAKRKVPIVDSIYIYQDKPIIYSLYIDDEIVSKYHHPYVYFSFKLHFSPTSTQIEIIEVYYAQFYDDLLFLKLVEKKFLKKMDIKF